MVSFQEHKSHMGDEKKPKVKFTEKRAAVGRERPQEPAEVKAAADAVMQTATDVAHEKHVESKRIAPGVRKWSEFFGEAQADRPITRSEYLRIRMMEEFSRREGTPWRRFWRWMRKLPQVHNVPAVMARDHQRALDKIQEQLEERAAEKKAAQRP